MKKDIEGLATVMLRQNHGAHVLVGPALLYGDKPALIIIVGGQDGQAHLISIGVPEDADLGWLKGLRGELIAAIAALSAGLVSHDCGDEEQLMRWAAACYPGPKIEGIKAKVGGGGAA